MSGLLSSRPSPGSVRLLLGSTILLLVQTWLIVGCAQFQEGMLHLLVGGIATLGLVALICAIVGEPASPAGQRRTHRISGGSLK